MTWPPKFSLSRSVINDRIAVSRPGVTRSGAIPVGDTRGRGLQTGFLTLVAALMLGFACFAPTPADGAVVPVTLEARQAMVQVAPGVKMRAWTFNGTVPAPVIRATEGDTVQVTLVNDDRGTPAKKVRVWQKARWVRIRRGKRSVKRKVKGRWRIRRIRAKPGMAHSLDFHAAEIAPDQAFRSIRPGESHTFSFVARRAGVYVYHCGTSPMLEHIGMGMYGAIVIDPVTPRPAAAKEITVVQSEFYGKVKQGRRLIPSHAAMLDQPPKYVAFNGWAGRYSRFPIKVPAGELVRINFVDAGPNLFSAFHIVGAMFDRYEPDGHPDQFQTGVSTQTIAPGGGGVFEVRFAEPGRYPFVSHSMRDMEKGAIGIFQAE